MREKLSYSKSADVDKTSRQVRIFSFYFINYFICFLSYTD